jgi:hypothetical protein
MISTFYGTITNSSLLQQNFTIDRSAKCVSKQEKESHSQQNFTNVHFIDHSVKKATKEMDPVRFKRRRKIWILLVVQQAPQTEFADHTISTTPQINQQTTVHINQSIHTGRVTLSECNSSACQSIDKKEFPLISFGYFSSTFFTVVRPNSTSPPTNTVKTRREEIKRSPTKTVKTRREREKKVRIFLV